MESLAEHYDREEAIRRSVRSAISYPLLMIGMMLVIIIILMTKVMPVFDQVFRQFGQEMTGFSRGILLAGNALSRYSAVFAVLLAVIVCAGIYFTKTESGRKKLYHIGSGFAFSRELKDKLSACRFAGGMSLALKSGLTPEQGMEFSENLIEDDDFRKKVAECKADMENGTDIAEALVKAGQLVATANFADAAKCDCVCICVPTPLDAHQQPDISYVRSSTESIMPYIHKDMLVVLESTTYPGTTEELCKPILEKSGLKCGEDFYLAFSPERVDPGNLIYKTKNTPKVVGGCTPKCTEIAAAMYETVLEAPVYKVSSPAIAEMEKILENTYRNVNIGLINELAILCDRMGINIWEVIDAAKSKPYGFQAFYPGPGLGGHCIPLDPYYLSWKASTPR